MTKFLQLLDKVATRLGKHPKLALMKLIQGGLLFAFGVLVIFVADNVLVASLAQEIVAAFGLLLAGVGVLWSAIGYLSMSVLRIYHMLKNKD